MSERYAWRVEDQEPSGQQEPLAGGEEGSALMARRRACEAVQGFADDNGEDAPRIGVFTGDTSFVGAQWSSFTRMDSGLVALVVERVA